MPLWIDKAIKRKSSLREQLNVPKGHNIPETTLHDIADKQIGSKVTYRGKQYTVTQKLKKRAVLARTLKDFQKRKSKRCKRL